MIRLLAILLALAAVPAAAQPAEPPSESVTIAHAGDRWTADFTFDLRSPVRIFVRSNVTRSDKTSWRARAWRVLTPGVELKRLGHYDALVAKSGNLPRRVRIEFTPFTDDLLADYDPALVFTDGSVALFTGHWDSAPIGSEEAAKALPSDLNGVPLEGSGTTDLTVRTDKGTILFNGVRKPELTLRDSNAYVLFGEPEIVDSPAITTIIDPQVPRWLSSEISDFTPDLLTIYAERLGPRAGNKPMVMVSWAGPTPKLRSLGGSVLPGLVLMRLEGEGLVELDTDALSAARWFIAHESSHFWLGQTVRYSRASEAWILEGGADLLAIRAVGEVTAAFDEKAELQKRLDDCQTLAADGAISTAGDRNQHDVFYACGAMFGLAAEAAAKRSGGDFYTFIGHLIDANRDDGTVDRTDWLATFSETTGSSEGAEIIAGMLDSPSPDADGKLSALFDIAGVSYSRDASGRIILN